MGWGIGASALAEIPLTIGFSQVGAESEWRTANTVSIKEAVKNAGVTLKFADAQQKQENQVKAIRSFIAQKVDVIAFSPVVESGWDTVLQEAKAAKIPVILTDRAVNVADKSLYVTFIGYAHNDDMAIGAIQAIEEAGLKPGKDIIVISVDGVKGAFEAMMAGKLNVTVECSPLLGPQLIAVARDVKSGKEVPKRITTQEGVFPAEVAAKEFPNRKY